ncbi:MAG: DUF1275 domain-containing protein [Acholeplasmatales bacterium]|nr:DUF1275 domain-containing protein [Acholeplasmatales bacterium]
MNKQKSESLILAIFLLIASGAFDAYSYYMRGGTFATMQTGNMILLGYNLINGNIIKGLMYLIPISSFFMGVFIATLIELKLKKYKKFHWRQLIIILEIAVIIPAMFVKQGDYNFISNMLVSFAAGMQLHSFRKIKGFNVATTMCTGNLKSSGQALAKYSYFKDKKYLKELGLYIILIISFIIGSIISFLLSKSLDIYAIGFTIIPLVIGICIMVLNDTDDSQDCNKLNS